jgi:phosphoadenosine phosphosulfate reductase
MNAATPIPVDTTDWSEQSTLLESATPIEIVRWAMETFREKLTMATAFGAEGCALIDMIARTRDKTGITPDIFNLDTGYQFPQTLALKRRLEKQYDLPIRFVYPEETPAQAQARLGGPPCLKEPDRCCQMRKVLPLREALKGFEAYITAVRRDQTPERAGIPIIGFDPRSNIVKISPLANWTRKGVWDYIRAHDVPTNPLHAQGFASIGCWPVTRAVEHGEDERAGRWASSDKRECGLHVHDYAPIPSSSRDVDVIDTEN